MKSAINMKFPMRIGICVLVGAISWISLTLPAGAAGEGTQLPNAAARDGAHDFDFNFGVWKTHLTSSPA